MSATAFNDIKYKASSGQINLDEAQGIVECFVAGIGNKDSVGDVCSSGSFTKSLMRRKPRVVWGHNWNDPIGKVLEIYEVPPSDPRLPGKMRSAGIGGLYARVQFNLNSEKGREAFSNIAFFGEDQEWSIGYKTIRAQFDHASQANILQEVELYEVSPVLHGANQLTGTISIKADEVGMTSSSPASVAPYGQQPSDEDNMHAKLEAELETRLGASVKVANVSDGMVHFTRMEQDGKSSMYKCRFSYGNDGVFMFGRPELISPPIQSQPSSMPMVKPVEMPNGMPMSQRRPQAGTPTPPGQTIVVPSTLPGATPASPPLVRVNYQQPPAPIGVPKLVPEERDLAEALVTIANRYGKFNEDATGIYAAYTPAAENSVAKIGVTCANCVLYAGGNKCKVIANEVEPSGKCRFAVIPDNVVSMNPIGKMLHDSDSEVNEISWIEDIEAKFPAEFVNGKLRNAVRRRHAFRDSSKSLIPISEFKENEPNDFSDFSSKSFGYVIPVDVDSAFETKQAIDPIIDYHRVDAYVEDGGIIVTNGVTKDFVDAVDAALKGLGNYPFFQSEKALGQGIGAGGNLAGRVSRAAAVFNPNAWDGDNDGLVQEGTPFQRPSIPGVNDFGTGGRVNPERALEAFVNGQGGEVSATGQVLPPRRTLGAAAGDAKKPKPKPKPSPLERALARGLPRPEDRSIGKGPRITNAEMDEFSARIERDDRERENRGLSSGGVQEGIAESELFSGSKWIEEVRNENLEMEVIPAADVYGPDQSGYTVVGRWRTEDGGEDWLMGGSDDEIFETVDDALAFINNYDRQIADDVYPDDPKFQSLARARTTGKTRANRGLSSGQDGWEKSYDGEEFNAPDINGQYVITEGLDGKFYVSRYESDENGNVDNEYDHDKAFASAAAAKKWVAKDYTERTNELEQSDMDSYSGDADTPPMSDDEMQAEADWAEANGLASGGKINRHSNRDAALERQFPDAEENAKREAHEKFISDWEAGMDMGFTRIERQRDEVGGKFSPDFLRAREVGYNDAKARWSGKGTSEQPKNFDPKAKASTDYSSWYRNVVTQLGRNKANRSQDSDREQDYAGEDAGIRDFLMSVAPDMSGASRETQESLAKLEDDYGFGRGGSSSGRSAGLASGANARRSIPSMAELKVKFGEEMSDVDIVKQYLFSRLDNAEALYELRNRNITSGEKYEHFLKYLSFLDNEKFLVKNMSDEEVLDIVKAGKTRSIIDHYDNAIDNIGKPPKSNSSELSSGSNSSRGKDFLPQSDSKRNSEKGKEKLTPEQMWEEGILGYTLDDLAERTGMTRQEVRKAQLDFIKSNSKDPEFRNRENDLRVHAEYMAQMEKLGIYPPGNPDYYSGSKDEKMTKAREAAAQVGLSVEEASAEADPRYWDYLTNKGTTSRLGLSSGKGGETPEERNNRQIYERRVTTGESLEDVANALGTTREDVRRSEMFHAKRLRDESLRMSLKDETSREKRDREIFDRRSTTGISIDALAEETGMSRSDIRQAEMRHASRLRNEPLSQRDERKNRLSSGKTASDGGKIRPESNPENVKRKASKDSQKLSSGESLDWTNPSDGLPSKLDNWTDNDWETYGSRMYIQRERRGSRPFGKVLSNGLREEIGSSVLPSKDGSPQYGMHTSDRGYAAVGKDEDGTWSATRLVFDDYEGYHTDDYDYDLGYEQGGFKTPEEASDWLANKIEEDGAYIYGDEKRDEWAKDKNVDASSDVTSMQDAWADYYKKQDESRLLGEADDGPGDVVRIQPGLSSGKSPYQMGGRIAAQVNKKIPPRTNYDYSPDGDRIPTEEQKTVIDAVMTGQNVLVPALAGTGKTSTLVSLAKRMKKEQPDKNLLYLAFNASAARDAERRFAGLNNVEVVTLDGIGKRWIEESRGKVGKRFSSRVDVINAGDKKKQSTVPEETFVPLTGRAIAKQLGLKTQVVDGREMSGDDIAKLAISAVKQFEISSDGQIGLQHFVDNKGKLISPDALPGNILDIANMHWKDKSGDSGTSIIQFNTLNKMWALSGPDFSEKGWGTKGAKDLVLYDEAQDLNPVWNAAAAGQSVQNVFVGDPNQAIYGFRGAVNELDSIAERSEYVLPITEVFRFGPEIAGYTNRALAILGIEDNRMVGRGKPGKVVEPGTMTDATMVINRTNGGVIRSALDEINNGRTVATTPNAKKEVEKTINSIKKLRFNTPSSNLHPDLEEFENWKELEDAVTNGTATGKQESLYRLMSNITLGDFQKVLDNLQIWDPSAGNDTELPEDLLDGANFPNGIAFASDNGVIYLTGKTYENKQKIGATRGFTFNKTTSRWELNPGSDEKRREILTAVRDISSFAQGSKDKSVPRLEMPDSIDVRGDLGGGVKYEISGSSISVTGNTYNMGTILRANGFSFDKDAKKWTNKTTRSEAERKSILESVVSQSIRESDAAKLADAKPSTGKPDVIVTTAHQAKGLETERGKLGSDWWGPKKDKVTGETIWPDEEHIHALYVALSRSMEVLDPGSASWITDWTDENDELSNTRGGLSSGKAKRVKGQLATRRPWSEEERQAFAGGQRQRAQTIPGKRKEGPSASEFGPGTNRRNRKINSSGLSSGGLGIDAGMGGLGIEEAKFGSNTADNPVNMKRRAVGGNVGGIGTIGAREQTKKTFPPFEDGSPSAEFRKNLQRTTGSSRWKPTLGKLETNRQSDGKTPWMLEANKIFELFKDSDGRQLDDDEILTALGYISESTKKGEVSRNEAAGRELLAELRKPGAAISEPDVTSFLEAIHPEDDTLSTPGNEKARAVWGFASAPRWLGKDGTAVSEEEFNSMSAKEIGRLSPDLGDFEDFELPSGEFERPTAKAAAGTSIGGRPLAEVNKKENFTADKLFDYLGIGNSDMSKSKRAELAVEVLKNEHNIQVSAKTVSEQWFKGIPTDAIQYLLNTGKIPSVSEVFGEQNSSFEQYPTALSAKRRVFDSLIESGISEAQAKTIFGSIFGGGTKYQGMLDSEQSMDDYISGKKPFAASGTVVKYDEKELGEIVDALNEARAKNGAAPVDARTLFGIKETAEAAAPKPSAPKTAPKAKPKGALIEQYPEVTRWENLSRSSAKNLSDDELDEAIGVLVALSNPVVKNVEGKLSFPDGLKPSDERVVNAQDALEAVQAIAEDRRIKKGLDEIEAEFGWRSPGDGLPPSEERNAEQKAEFLKRGDILEQRNLVPTRIARIKSAWSGVSVRTKGDRAQRYKIA